MITENGILYIEPSAKTSEEPVIDEYTRKMTAAFRQGKQGPAWRGKHMAIRGWHTCECGAHSTNCDYTLPNGEITNSLAIHYLAFHREDIPPAQFEKVSRLNYGEAEPTAKELNSPRKKESDAEIKSEIGHETVNKQKTLGSWVGKGGWR